MQQRTGCTAHIVYGEILNMLTIFIYYFHRSVDQRVQRGGDAANLLI